MRRRNLVGMAAMSGAAALVAGLVQSANATEPNQTGAAGTPTGITTISTGWTIPWGASWLPDGSSALVTERNSFKVFKVTPSGARTEVGSVPNSQTTGGEGGLSRVCGQSLPAPEGN